MHIIDRYMLRQYVQNFLICFLSLMGLYVVIETTANLDTYIHDGKLAGGVLALIARTYAYKLLLFFNVTASQLAMISAMFTIAWIQRHNEMTALMAAGVSRIRVVRPIIIAAVVIALLAAADREFLIPRYRDQLSLPPQNPIGIRPQSFGGCRDNQTDVELSGKNTYAHQRRIEEPVFDMPLPLRDHGTRIVAENAYYRPPEGSHPGGWLMDQVREPKHIESRSSLSWNGRPVLLTPRETDWLKPDQCFLVSNLSFDQLNSTSEMQMLSSTRELIAGLHNPSQDYGARIRVAIHARIVQPLLDLTLLFLALPLIITRENRNVFIAMGLCMAVTTVFSLVVVGMQAMGGSSVIHPPVLAAWGPLFIFLPIAVGTADALWR